MSARRGPVGGVTLLAGFALLAAGFSFDFYGDVRTRDVFTWMDPTQYYDFSRAVLAGREPWNGFEVASAFPFLVMPPLLVETSVRAALWVNIASLGLLLLAVHGLCRELEIALPSPLVAALALSSPLLIGLSRSLYVEFTLTAVVAFAFRQWLRLLRAPGRGNATRFAVVFALGTLLKATFPLFFVLPAAFAFADRLAGGRRRDAGVLVAALALPALVVLLVQVVVFAPSLAYYATRANTTLPIMYLIGPPQALSTASLIYYASELWHTLLWLLSPLLLLAAWQLARRPTRPALPAGAVSTLWLWLLGPLLLLVAEPVKEPRHVAPCVVPGVLLLVLGIEAVPRRAPRVALLAAALAAAAFQYAAVTTRAVGVPYFADRSLHTAEIEQALDGAASATAEDPEETFARRYAWDLAITGFPPNEALALVWWAFPGVVHDLDVLDDAASLTPELPLRQFEDPYVLTAFNSYNRRNGWRHYYPTLGRDAILANADWVIANLPVEADPRERFPARELVATILRGAEAIHLLRARHGGRDSFRTLWARRFLEANPGLSREERRVIARELQMVVALTGERSAAALLSRLPNPVVDELRNIYWIGGYPALLERTDRLLARRPPRRGS